MNRNNTVATRCEAADAHADRLFGLLSSRDYRRLQPHLRRVPDVGTIGMEVVGLPLPLGPLNRHRRGIVILDRQGRRQSAAECSGRVGNLLMAFDRLEAAEQGGG